MKLYPILFPIIFIWLSFGLANLILPNDQAWWFLPYFLTNFILFMVITACSINKIFKNYKV